MEHQAKTDAPQKNTISNVFLIVKETGQLLEATIEDGNNLKLDTCRSVGAQEFLGYVNTIKATAAGNKKETTEAPVPSQEKLELDDAEKKLFASYCATERPPNKKHIFILTKDSGELIAALAEDGELRLGNDTKEAAQEFWKYVQMLRPVNCCTAEELSRLKADCYDLIQENKALKSKLALMLK